MYSFQMQDHSTYSYYPLDLQLQTTPIFYSDSGTVSFRFARRHSAGGFPVSLRNTRQKYAGSRKPTCSAMASADKVVSLNKYFAFSIRLCKRYLPMLIPCIRVKRWDIYYLFVKQICARSSNVTFSRKCSSMYARAAPTIKLESSKAEVSLEQLIRRRTYITSVWEMLCTISL